MTFRESDSLTAGDDVTVVSSPWGFLGVGICYDIRFPELAMVMRQRGCGILFYPGAFNMVTGPKHWQLLVRARAVDNQVFVVGCSPASNPEGGGYVAYGHSCVVDPWGEVMAEAAGEAEVLFAELDLEAVDTVRQNIPCGSQKRADLYAVHDKSSTTL